MHHNELNGNRNFDCKVTRKTPEGLWDATGRNAHLIWGLNMGSSVIWYDCVSNCGLSRVNNLIEESLERAKTSDETEGQLDTELLPTHTNFRALFCLFE